MFLFSLTIMEINGRIVLCPLLKAKSNPSNMLTFFIPRLNPFYTTMRLTSADLPGDGAPFLGDPLGVMDFVGDPTLAPTVCALATREGGNRLAHEGPVSPTD